MSWVVLWSRAFALTVLSELLVAPWFLPKREPRWRRLGAVVVANCASHPAVWFVFPELGLSYMKWVLLAELWAFGSEVFVYRLVFPELGWRRAVAASALANAASVAAGLVARALGLPL